MLLLFLSRQHTFSANHRYDCVPKRRQDLKSFETTGVTKICKAWCPFWCPINKTNHCYTWSRAIYMTVLTAIFHLNQMQVVVPSPWLFFSIKQTNPCNAKSQAIIHNIKIGQNLTSGMITVLDASQPSFPLASSRNTNTLQSSSNSLTFPKLLQVFPTESLIFIKPPEVYRQAYVYSWVNIVALLAVHLLHVNFT